MKTFYNIKKDEWQIQTSDILPKHDMVFGMPVNDKAYSIPLGDGDTGSLLWLEEDGIHIHVNKTDLFDEIAKDRPQDPENNTCLRHGGEIIIKLKMPCFSEIYQKKFEARLSLKDATAYLNSETAFSSVKINAT